MSSLLTILVLAATASLGQGAVIWVEDLRNTEISEYAQPGYFVGTLEAKDSDSSITLTYGIYDRPDDDEIDAYNYLQVDGPSGNVTVRTTMDYEMFRFMTAEWEAGSYRTTVTIYIGNENDNIPVFHGEPYSAEISENVGINTSVTIVNATDGDIGDTVSYYLYPGRDCEMDHFRVDQTSGEIFVYQTLDYASVVQYRVCVNASDEGGRFDTTVVVISIRDAQNQPPVFIGQPYDKTIPEDTPVGEIVLTVVANDGDLGVNHRNEINYSLIDDANGTFSIEPNGDIVVKKVLERDTDPITQLYTLIVQAVEDDPTQPPTQITTNTSVYIRLSDVDDNFPTFYPEGPVYTTIPEHSPRGTQLNFGLEAFDLDSGDAGKITLTLEDDDGIFYLVSRTIYNSGVVDIRVGNSTALDFEKISEVSFQINATSGLNSSLVSAIVYLTNINDEDPVFIQSQYYVSLPEDSVENTFVIQIEATDDDMDSELEYGLEGYKKDWFNINSSTGNIIVSADAKFIDEPLSVYFLTCVVRDGQRVSTALLSVTVTDVNNNAPQFSSDRYTEFIPEYNLDEKQEELNILQVVATDADTDDTNNKLTYSIVSGNKGGKFGINSTTGIIFRNASIDLEKEEEKYDLVVMATDSGTPSMNDSTTVTINIEDVNDNDPLFLMKTYNAEVAENADFGAFVTNVTAVDADVGSLPVLYTIVGESPYFFVSPHTGIITLSGTVNYEMQMTHKLNVTATDREEASRQDSCQVLIEVLDVNDEPPVFKTPSPFSISVIESATYCRNLTESDDCKVLITLNASDPDTNASLTYTISKVKGYDENSRQVHVDGGFSNQFGVENETGEIFVQMELDRETVQRFDVTVRVWDENAIENTDTQFDSAELVITVLDVNDNAPNFTDQLPNSFTMLETDQIGMVISADIRAEDIDAGDNGLVSYELLDDADRLVKIDRITGILSVAQPIDKEQHDSLSIIICAEDEGDPPLNNTLTRQIFIIDVNDNTPVFNDTLTQASIFENSARGTFVLRVHATDADSVYGNLTYSISAGVGSGVFEIDNKTVSTFKDSV